MFPGKCLDSGCIGGSGDEVDVLTPGNCSWSHQPRVELVMTNTAALVASQSTSTFARILIFVSFHDCVPDQ